MKAKRLIAMLLSLVMVLSLAACGKPADSETEGTKTTEAPTTGTDATKAPETEPGTEAAEFDPRTITEGVTLKVVVESDDEVIDWNTNQATLIIEEKFGVDLVFEDYAAGTFIDKLSVMINGGDKLPDIILAPGTSGGLKEVVTSWTSSGAILALNDYYANPDYAKYTNIAIEKEGVDFVATLKDVDGNVWGFPRYSAALNDVTAKRLWINKEYAKAVGFDEMPTTTDEFFELCKAFAAAGDLNGNGIDDEVVFTGRESVDQNWFKFLMTPFVDAWDDHCLEVTDGKLEFAFTTDGWKNGLKYIKQFFDEGLLDSTIITQDKAAYQAIAYDPEMRVLAEFYYWVRMVGEDDLETYACRNAYDYVCALEAPNGRGKAEAYYADAMASYGAMITADCENPEAAFIVLDYFMSQEHGIRNRNGEEGVNWDFLVNLDESKLKDGVTKDMIGPTVAGKTPEYIAYNDAEYWGVGKPQNAGYMGAGAYVHFTGANSSILYDANSDDPVTREKAIWTDTYQSVLADMLELKPEERIVTLPTTADEDADIAEVSKVVKNYWKTAAANFITGEWDIDGQWDEYLAELEKMGVADLLAVYQTAYDRTK